ncbi:transcription elongation factor Spt5 [Candidatus Micrarchaeota archaeon]|nr:transcription elongation factor Spt5 [Candidatus Micrarchaeota archaeon]
MLFAFRVTSGQENIVADLLYEKVKKNQIPVKSIIVSPYLKGYLIAEAENEIEAKRLITNVPHVKSMLHKPMQIEELKDMLESKPAELAIEEGQLVEITSGPFKGEKAKIVKILREKEDVIVELVEVAVPIPVTIKINTIKLLPQ